MFVLAFASIVLAFQKPLGTQLVVPQGKIQASRKNLPSLRLSRGVKVESLSRQQVRSLVVDNKLGSDVEGGFSLNATKLVIPGKAMMTLVDAGRVAPYDGTIEFDVRQMGSTTLLLSLENLQKGGQYLVIVNAYHETSNKSPLKAQFYWSGLSQNVDILPKENHLSFVYTAPGTSGGLGISFFGEKLQGEYQIERLIVSSVDVQKIK